MQPKGRKNKGSRFEREVAKIFDTWAGLSASLPQQGHAQASLPQQGHAQASLPQQGHAQASPPQQGHAQACSAQAGNKEFSRAWLSRGQDDRTDDLKCPAWFPFIVSCKHVENWSLDELFRTDGGLIRQWWAEIVKKATRAPVQPLLIFKKNYFPALVALTATRANYSGPFVLVSCDLFILRLADWLEANPATHFPLRAALREACLRGQKGE